MTNQTHQFRLVRREYALMHRKTQWILQEYRRVGFMLKSYRWFDVHTFNDFMEAKKIYDRIREFNGYSKDTVIFPNKQIVA